MMIGYLMRVYGVYYCVLDFNHHAYAAHTHLLSKRMLPSAWTSVLMLGEVNK